MGKVRVTVLVLIVGALLVVSAWLGTRVPFSQQWPAYEALRTTASIIFAVVGAWLAISYPERLRLTLKGESSNLAPAPRVSALMTPIAHSTFILMAILLVGLLAPLVKGLPFVQAHKEVFRGASYMFVAALTIWQIGIVLLTLKPADSVKQAEDHLMAKQKRLSGLFGQTSSGDGDGGK